MGKRLFKIRNICKLTPIQNVERSVAVYWFSTMRNRKVNFIVFPGVTAEFLKTMTQNLNFTVDLHQPQLPVTGIFNQTTQQWNGVIGELVSDLADFSISPTAITEIRSKYVTFSSGFMLKYNRKVENI